MSDLVERINLIIAQCRDSNESAGLWIEIRDEIERLRAALAESCDENRTDVREVSIDQIRKTFEAGYWAAAVDNMMDEEEAKRRLQDAWRKFCGVNT